MDEEEICRVCRCGATPEQPLFHPCKCSGSIRHVHQDCLTEWLSHSRKKYCELCEHPFAFTPVYREDMPERLPWILFIRQLYKKTITILCVATRAIFVSCTWFILIPYLTVWNWRFYLWSGENLAAQLDRLQDARNTTHGPSIKSNDTADPSSFSNNTSSANDDGSLYAFFNQIDMRTFWSDCFEGQMIACIVVVLFAAAFLLREWLVQNIPTELDVDEEEENDQRAETPPLAPTIARAESDEDDLTDEEFYHHIEPPPMDLMLQQPHRPHHNGGRYTENFIESNDHIFRGEDGSSNSSIGSDSEDEEADHEMLVPRGEPPNAPFMRHMDHHQQNFDIQQQQQQQRREERHHHPQNNAALAVVENNNEMEEENLGDEIDGVLEVIGMRGSFWMLAQNSLLMTLLISLCLGITIWMPYIVGISFFMATPLEIVNGVLWLVRKATDPILDSIFYLCIAHIWPFVMEFYRSYLNPHISHYVESLAQHPFASNLMAVFRSCERFVYYIFQTHDNPSSSKAVSSSFFDNARSSVAGSTSTSPSSSLALGGDNLWITLQHYLDQVQPILESISSISRGFAIGKTGYDRFMCVSAGYAVIFLLIASAHVRSSHGAHNEGGGMFTKTFRQVIRQQSIILKVGMFITIELLLFPIVCGILLDVSSLPAFRNATISSRIEHLQGYPLASIFLHWFLGTAFMFLFAAVITMCRECIRPGVLWFIRDPNDPQFHPIKEIVERPALSQLQKLGASSILYAIVIISGVSTTAWCLQLLRLDILPLRWHMLQPLSTVPIDFLVMHIAVPAMIRYLQPKATIKKLAMQWMKLLCRGLRLSSYMLGERHLDEEGVYRHPSNNQPWRRLLFWNRQHPSFATPTSYDYIDGTTSFMRDGQFVLAPKLDNIPYVPGRRMLVPVDPESLQILDPVERELGHPAASGTDDILTNTTIVYLPPLFKQRMTLFLFIMWTTSIAAACAATALPIVLGRWVYHTALGPSVEVHDVYAYFTGGFLLVMLTLLIVHVAKTIAGMYRSTSPSMAYGYLKQRLGMAFYLVAKLLYIGVTMGLMIPVLLGLITEMYLVMPMRDLGTQPPSIELLPIWTRGFVCMSIIRGMTNLVPENEWHNRVNAIFQPDLHAVNIRDLTTKVVMPVMAVGLAAILIPVASAIMLIKSGVFGDMDSTTRIRFIQSMYPAAMVTVVVYYLCHVGAKFMQSWVQAVREDNYLVGTILHNLES